MQTQTYPFILLFSLLTIISCSSNQTETPAENMESVEASYTHVSQAQFDSMSFELGKPEIRSFPKTIRVYGYSHIPESQKFVVSSVLEGVAGSFNLIEGQHVSKGQVLFSVLNTELINLQEEYLILKNKIPLLTEENERQQAMFAENITSKKESLASQLNLNESKSRLAALEKKFQVYGIQTSAISNENMVSKIYVRSPMNGFVSEINIHQGTFLSASSPALLISGNDDLHLELKVLEKDALNLKKGQKILFYVQNKMDKPFEAEVGIIKNEVDEDHMVSVHCEISSKAAIIAGMYVVADIDLGDESWASLPETAVTTENDKSFITELVNKDGGDMVFRKVPVVKTIGYGGWTGLTQIDTNATYLTKGAYFVH